MANKDMNREEQYPLMDLYTLLMSEISKRMHSLDDLFRKSMKEPLNYQELEYLALQIRLVLETIILATFVANKRAFDAIQSNLSSRFRVRAAINEARRLNPDFYPIPYEIDESNGRTLLNPPTQPYLTLQDLEKGMDRCHKLLHVRGPKTPLPNGNEILEEFFVLREKIAVLLRTHRIRLADDTGSFLVQLRNPKEDKPVWYRMEPTAAR